MEDALATIRTGRSALPWVIVALVVFAAGASLFWMNNKIEALGAAKARTQEVNGDDTRRAVAAIRQRLIEVQKGQTALTDQVTDFQRRIAAEQGERKLLSGQLGSISQRLDALSSSSADANQIPQQPQRNGRSKR